MEIKQTLRENLESMLVENIEALNNCDDIKPDRKIFAMSSAIASLEALQGGEKVEEEQPKAKQAMLNFQDTPPKPRYSQNSSGELKMKKIRIEKGMTQEELAYRCGFSQNTLSHIERGNRVPNYMQAKAIAKGLNFTGNPHSLFKQKDASLKRPPVKTGHILTNLQYVREKNGLLQTELAALASIPKGCVSLLEGGHLSKHRPSTLKYCLAVAEAIDWQDEPLALLDEYKGDE